MISNPTEFTNRLAKLVKGCGTIVYSQTIPTMNKIGNPYYGRVIKRSIWRGVQIGTNYQNSMNNAMKRSGLDIDYIPRKNWQIYYNAFLDRHKTKDRFYLQIQWQKHSEFFRRDNTYYLDGVEVTDKRVLNDIMSWEKEDDELACQDRQGVTENNKRYYRVIKIENVQAIVQDKLKVLF